MRSQEGGAMMEIVDTLIQIKDKVNTPEEHIALGFAIGAVYMLIAQREGDCDAS